MKLTFRLRRQAALRRRGALAVLPALALLLAAGPTPGAEAASPDSAPALPQPPCGERPWPAYAAPGAEPATAAWSGDVLAARGWRPAACTGWGAGAAASRTVVALAGRVALGDSGDSSSGDEAARLLARVGAVSRLGGLPYWSAREQRWRPLAHGASALAGGPGSERRADFTPAELAPGTARFYWMDDSRSGAVTYRLQVLERGAARLVVAQENASAVRAFGLTLFEPGALQTVAVAERLGPGDWGLYLLTRIDRAGSSALAGGGEDSLRQRALALFRLLAGTAPGGR